MIVLSWDVYKKSPKKCIRTFGGAGIATLAT